MTRDEAIRIQMDFCPVSNQHPKYIETGRVIDRFVALGILKLDEPKSAETRMANILAREFGHCSDLKARGILAEMWDAGLRVAK